MGCIGEDAKKRKKTAAKNDKVPDKGTVARLPCVGPQWPATELAKERPVVQLHMGQAAVGDLRTMQLFSEEFSTCSPIVMFNSATRMGALFHMPGNALEENEIVLEAICRAVDPTEIWVYPGGNFGQEIRMAGDAQLQADLVAWHQKYTAFLGRIASPDIVHDGTTPEGRGTGALKITANGDRLETSTYVGLHPSGLHDVGKSQDGPAGCTVYQRTDWTLEI